MSPVLLSPRTAIVETAAERATGHDLHLDLVHRATAKRGNDLLSGSDLLEAGAILRVSVLIASRDAREPALVAENIDRIFRVALRRDTKNVIAATASGRWPRVARWRFHVSFLVSISRLLAQKKPTPPRFQGGVGYRFLLAGVIC